MMLLAALTILLVPQDQGEILARYRLGDRPAAVTRTDVAVEMGFHLRRQDVAREACEMLVDATLTRKIAEQKKLMPSTGEVEQFWHDLQQQLRGAGQDPSNFAAVRNSTEAEWLRDLSVQLAQKRLVRDALELGDDEPVTGDMLRLWIAEQRKSAVIVTDPDALPIGTAARVDGRDIQLTELGLLLFRTSSDADRERFVRQVIYLNSVEHLAAARGISLDQTQLEAGIAERRRLAATDPRYQGLSFDQLLRSKGLTIAALKQSRVFRAKLLQERLCAALHPPASLRAELETDRAGITDWLGARRRLGVIFRRAQAEPNALVPHDFASAARSLEQVKQRLELEQFGHVARVETDDARGKRSGGDLGWLHRRTDALPEAVLVAAFAAQKGELLGPLAAEDGCYLVKLLDVEPAPDDDELLRRLRQRHSDELTQKILADAAIEWPTTKDGDK